MTGKKGQTWIAAAVAGFAVLLATLLTVFMFRALSVPPPQPLSISEIEEPIVLKPEESVRIGVGWHNPSVGTWYALTEVPAPEIVEVEEVNEDPLDPSLDGAGGNTYLVVTALAPGEGTIKVADCFRQMPDATGICHDDDGPRPTYTVDIVVEEG